MDRLKHEVECLRVQQRQGHQSTSSKSVEARHSDVQQVKCYLDKTAPLLTNTQSNVIFNSFYLEPPLDDIIYNDR